MRPKLSVVLGLQLAVLLLAACSSPKPPETRTAEPPPAPTPAPLSYEEMPVPRPGTITGTVKFAGARPQLTPRPVPTKNPEICGHGPKPSEEILLGPGAGLQNAVVFIEGIKRGKKMPLEATAVLDQKKCDYIPHVQAVTVNTTLDILNSDDLLHNVHGKLNGRETVFNLAMPLKGQKIPKKLTKPGVIALQCDAGHTWMKGYVVVVDNPYYALSDKKGSFSLTELPPGIYQVKAWHERLGTREQSVAVNAGAESKVSFEFKAP